MAAPGTLKSALAASSAHGSQPRARLRVLGCYGNQTVQTPILDALAARGTLFRNAYCPTPICVPSRASLATGRYAHTIDSWDNGTPYVGTEAPSWGHRLSEQGHKVTTIGK